MLMQEEVEAMPVVSPLAVSKPAPASTTTPMPVPALTTPAPTVTPKASNTSLQPLQLAFEPLQLSFQPIQLPQMPAVPAAVSPAAADTCPAVGAPEPSAEPSTLVPAAAVSTETADLFPAVAVPEPSVEAPTLLAAAAEASVHESADCSAPDDDLEPLADPPAEPTALLGIGAKMLKSKTKELAESEKVKQGLSFIKDKATVVAQHEKVQQGVSFVKRKGTEVSESESFQKGVEKTKQAIEVAKDKTKSLQQKAGNVWQAGRGSISRVRANVNNMSWKGSARDTLDIAAREEQWKGIKIQGAEEINVPARTEHTCCYHVSKGSTLRWTFRVKDNDIGFGVRMRVQEWGGSREDDVLGVERYDSADTISGSWVADEDRTIVLVFDNRYSKLRSKTVAYFTGTEKPTVLGDTFNTEPAVAA